ncbi:MAG: 2-oxoglutarate dehydrogenase E1 component [Chloroflexaceae bacterium]|nr:2-oxoglutarate dehydrogenase E1 component [Chloroflexaceae bacterium]
MQETPLFHGPNEGYVLELYERYLQNPEAVDAATRAFFATWTPPADTAPPAPEGTPTHNYDVTRTISAARLIRYIRELGHLDARIDPLGSPPPGDAGLTMEVQGVTPADLKALPASIVRGPLVEGAKNAEEAVAKLRGTYSGSIAYETDHIHNYEERTWLRQTAEDQRFFHSFTPARKRELLERLSEVETFERFLHQTFVGQKRFSIEGCDMMVPMVDAMIRNAAAGGTREVVIGMAHRGRLNVLAHILGKPYADILTEFYAANRDDGASPAGKGTGGWTGDVKYHLGARLAYKESGINQMPITLAPNPSHLEFVNPVVQGRARAAQEQHDQPGLPTQDKEASLAILIHGDAAFPGQGVVAETLNLSRLNGYSTGGTIHIITNNQVGFTTNPSDTRSTLYASDLAKGFEIPIVHVNADDVLACIAVARMAWAYRDLFGKDFLIDLVGYRRWGHNEGDEPGYTQPTMYAKISKHPTVREIWAGQLANEGVVTKEQSDEMVTVLRNRLRQAQRQAEARAHQGYNAHGDHDEALNAAQHANPLTTAVPAEQLRTLNEAMLERPEGFAANEKLERILQRRRTALEQDGGIEWGHAEALAFASILADGTPIRLTGQDSERGTFNQRFAVLYSTDVGARYVPLQRIAQPKASFAVYNSPLSEAAVLGFEYGYSMHAPHVLVLWEAQFGDFGNGAQVIIDQFIVSGRAKWSQTPSLVLLLPHGYEGQGPEHSSARLERYLQLCAHNNIRVVNPTTAAQYFHLLRRQAASLRQDPVPLVVMTPKSLLRHPRATSNLNELTSGSFRPVIGPPPGSIHPENVSRLVLCSGKVYVDLVNSGLLSGVDDVAVARVEELYPFPAAELSALIDSYSGLRELVWLQEEPQNMGAWSYIAPKLRELAGNDLPLSYCGRGESASPAEGSLSAHVAEQGRILRAVVQGVGDVVTK